MKDSVIKTQEGHFLKTTQVIYLKLEYIEIPARHIPNMTHPIPKEYVGQIVAYDATGYGHVILEKKYISKAKVQSELNEYIGYWYNIVDNFGGSHA